MTSSSSRVRFALGTTALAIAVVTSAAPANAASSAPVTPSPPAAATPSGAVGVVSALPANGTDQVPLDLATSALCPHNATNVIGTILGPGLPDIGINVVPNTSLSIYPRTSGGGEYLSSNNTLRNLVNELPDPPVLQGTYTLQVQCRGPSLIADLGDFYGSLVFDGHHNYVAKQVIPGASLTTVPAPEGPPVASAIGSHAPETATTSTPPFKGKPLAAATSQRRSYGPWLIGFGIVIVLGGVGALLRGRRGGKGSSPEGGT